MESSGYGYRTRKDGSTITPQQNGKGIPGQCQYQSHAGQCGLRGSGGHAGPGDRGWYCAFHNRVLSRVHDDEGVLIQNSMAGLARMIRLEKAQGATRWDHRTLEAWWVLAEGTQQPTECKIIPGQPQAQE